MKLVKKNCIKRSCIIYAEVRRAITIFFFLRCLLEKTIIVTNEDVGYLGHNDSGDWINGR